jgi:hypothetical protein
MVSVNYLTLLFCNKKQEERYQIKQMELINSLITHIVVALVTMNLCRVILYAADGKDDDELIGGLILLLLAPSLKCFICVGPIKRLLCVISLAMVYFTIIEWSLSFDDIYGFENRTLWVLLVSLVAFEGICLFTWSFLIFAMVVSLFTVYAIVRTYYFFGDLDLPASLLAGLLPIILSYIKGYYYRNLYDFADGYKEEAQNWKQALEFAPQGIVIMDKSHVYYHNKVIGENFGVFDSENLFNVICEIMRSDKKTNLLEEIETVISQKDRAESIYFNKVEALGTFLYTNDQDGHLEYEIMARFIVW